MIWGRCYTHAIFYIILPTTRYPDVLARQPLARNKPQRENKVSILSELQCVTPSFLRPLVLVNLGSTYNKTACFCTINQTQYYKGRLFPQFTSCHDRLEPATPRWEIQHSNHAATPTCLERQLGDRIEQCPIGEAEKLSAVKFRPSKGCLRF